MDFTKVQWFAAILSYSSTSFLAFCSPFVILRDTCRVRVGCSHIHIILSTLSYFDFIFPLVYPISPFAYYFPHTFSPILVVCMPFFSFPTFSCETACFLLCRYLSDPHTSILLYLYPSGILP